jgi:pilus assembly protein FimV
MKVKSLILLAFVVLLPHPPTVLALVLSEVELQTHLNQQLSARIELQSISAEELDQLSISVSELDPGQAGGGRTVLKYEVVTEGSNHYLMISSRDVIREPILDFVVDVRWATGHLIRNYALIIDPQ